MNKPDWSKTYETFVLIPGNYGPDKKEIGWNTYISFFRKAVAPVIWLLFDRGMVSWFSFLIHGLESGVPLAIKGIYVHLRFSIATSFSIEDIEDCLPPHFQGTRKMETPDTLDAVKVETLTDYDEGWRLMGESSIWMMNLLGIHKEGDIPKENIQQFLHYLENMLLIDILREDRQARKCKELGWLYTKCFNLLQHIEKKVRREK